jgi:hypothetical protein
VKIGGKAIDKRIDSGVASIAKENAPKPLDFGDSIK